MLTFLGRHGPTARALRSTILVGLGAIAFFAVAGLVLVVAGEAATSVVRFDTTGGKALRAAVGSLLIVLGLSQASLIKTRFRLFDSVAGRWARRFDPSRYEVQARRDLAYGFGYLLAGFG